MTITVESAVVASLRPVSDRDDMELTCEHFGCQSGEPTSTTPLFPGGPARPASWGGAGAGPARRSGPPCPEGLERCCGRCGCGGE